MSRIFSEILTKVPIPPLTQLQCIIKEDRIPQELMKIFYAFGTCCEDDRSPFPLLCVCSVARFQDRKALTGHSRGTSICISALAGLTEKLIRMNGR
jgi:hypothetical protein